MNIGRVEKRNESGLFRLQDWVCFVIFEVNKGLCFFHKTKLSEAEVFQTLVASLVCNNLGSALVLYGMMLCGASVRQLV